MSDEVWTGPSREFGFAIEAGHVLAFARAIGEARHDVVPPTFAVVADQVDPEFARRPRLGAGWNAGPPESHLHVEQHFDYTRPLEIGEQVTARRGIGRTWTRQGRTGRLDFVEERTELLDRDGHAVVVARWVDVHTEQQHLALTNRQRVAGPQPGDGSMSTRPPGVVVAEEITPTQFVMYVGAAGDFHPLHHDSEFARRAGYPSVFAPGMLTMALTGRVVTQMIAPESLRQFSGRFRAQVWPGDTLVVESSWSSTSGHETLSLTTRNQHGLTVFEGQASAAR